MASAHIVEVGDRAAGIVVRGHGGFRFFALELVFYPLEGFLFRTVDQAVHAARECLRPCKMLGRGSLN
jgi:hypothetical protein